MLTREAALAGTDAPAVHRLQGNAERPLHLRTENSDMVLAFFRTLQQHPAARGVAELVCALSPAALGPLPGAIA